MWTRGTEKGAGPETSLLNRISTTREEPTPLEQSGRAGSQGGDVKPSDCPRFGEVTGVAGRVGPSLVVFHLLLTRSSPVWFFVAWPQTNAHVRELERLLMPPTHPVACGDEG